MSSDLKSNTKTNLLHWVLLDKSLNKDDSVSKVDYTC